MRRTAFYICMIFACLLSEADAAELSARAQVSGDDVYQGDNFVLQIIVSGTDSPSEPDLSALKDFNVESLGGHKSNSESITWINGKMTRHLKKAYIFQYRLTPKKTGRLVIPALIINADGTNLVTRPVPINVGKPAESKDFKLRVSLSKTKCYVGEPVVLSVTWYISKDVRNFNFNIPVLDDKRFRFDNISPKSLSHGDLLQIPLAGDNITARKGLNKLDGKQYTTLFFKKVIIPTETGTFRFKEASVVFEALTGYRRSRDPFDNFFGPGRRGIYKKFAVPSNALSLEVLPVPEKGKPDLFFGHIGKYDIETSATPTEVNVGDPITLKIRISGPDFLSIVELPPLGSQPDLARDFKIPPESSPGKIEGNSKVFKQTIRALRSDVTRIPPIKLPYFDTESGTYSVAESEPVPLSVRETKIVTSLDTEGREIVSAKSELKAWRKGIAHNYEDLGVIEDTDASLGALLHNPLLLAVLIVPFMVYLILLASTAVSRRRRMDPDAGKSRKALRTLRNRINDMKRTGGVNHANILAAFREFLGSRLLRPAGSVTFRDVEDELSAAGMSESEIASVKNIFTECEAGSYTGSSGSPGECGELADAAIDAARSIERRLK